MAQLTIRKQISGGFLLLTGVVIFVGINGFLGLSHTIDTAETIAKQIRNDDRFLANSINQARLAQVDFKKQVQDWKDTLLRGNDKSAFSKYFGEFEHQEKATRHDLLALRKMYEAAHVDTKAVDLALANSKRLGIAYRKAIKSYDSANPTSCFIVDRSVKGIDRGPTKAIGAIVKQAQALHRNTTRASEELLRRQTRRTQHFIATETIIGTAIAILCAWLLSLYLTRRLSQLAQTLDSNSSELSRAADQVSRASQTLSHGTSEQAAAIEETSSSLEEMASMTRQNAENARKAKILMGEASQAASQAKESMVGLTSSMQEISGASEKTQKIIKTIDEISFQTNLLALNAAVEAARAGEAGAGFAVVADEVRNLAMRAAEAAKNTAALIEGTVKKVKDGASLVEKIHKEFEQVAGTVARSDEIVGEITAASGEQAQGIEQINRAVSEMDKVVQQNSANAEESSSASEKLSGQAGRMKEVVVSLAVLVGRSGSAG
ncbi:MAG: methyl-accepting chemotaxis protein [Syntrophobacteraceae bacterium]